MKTPGQVLYEADAKRRRSSKSLTGWQMNAIQRRKGTASSVRDVVRSFGGSLALREWWQMAPRGDPHTFS
ncbi:MAG: phage tail protein I, partial [Proteobacteria bacterium]